MFSPSSPLTGQAITGLTSPTYTLTQGVAPSNWGKQYAVTALGGTQTGVTAHTPDSPFTATMFVPSNYRLLGSPNPVTGIIASVPKNTTKILCRKGVSVSANQPKQVATIRIEIDIPAGAESYDKPNLDALFSMGIGLLGNQAQGIRDTVSTSIM